MHIRHIRRLVLAVALAVALGALSPVALAPHITSPPDRHYTLNIIGVSNPKIADMQASSGHSIFVPLTGESKILLGPGPYRVLDGNATDDGEAKFQLPVPDEGNTGTTVYSVFARALGTPVALGAPGGSSAATVCQLSGGTEICSLSLVSLTRDLDARVGALGMSSFTNVSKELLYIYTEDGRRLPLFGEELKGELWRYNNDGLRVAQLRFYECETEVPEAEDPTDPIKSTACPPTVSIGS